MKKRILSLTLLATLGLSMVSCNESYRTAKTITPQQFVDALNNINGYSEEGGYQLVKGTDETIRTGYFVIWNPRIDRGLLLSGDYQGISLDFIRNIEVYSSSLGVNSKVADAFEGMVASGSLNRNQAEELDIDGIGGFFTNRFESESDGMYEYDFGRSSRDTGAMAEEIEGQKIAQKALKIAATYEMSLESAAKIAILGAKASSMAAQGHSQEEIKAVTSTHMSDVLGISSVEELETLDGQNQAIKAIGISANGINKLLNDLEAAQL